MTKLQQTFLALLKIHNGACSIPKDHELRKTARDFVDVGLVTEQPNSCGDMIEFKLFNYKLEKE
jgi:hypothetical protein